MSVPPMNADTRGELPERVEAVLPAAAELRHALHRIPEPGLEERQTAELLRAYLRPLPLEILPSPLPTATVALLRGAAPGAAAAAGQGAPGLPSTSGKAALERGVCAAGLPNVTLRADIDALPLAEASGAAWSSKRPGFAHACGHDGHMAILAGAAQVLAGLAGRLAGSVRFVFQPAEEELGGGRSLVEAGLLEAEPRAGAVFALHGWPGLPLGLLASRAGPIMAAADRFTLAVNGRGGHGARPHLTVDPVVAAARVIEGLQTIPSRSVDPLEPVVVSVCSIHGGNANNVIPGEVVMEGTTRFFNPALQPFLRRRMEEILRGACLSAGAEHALDYRPGYPATVNDGRMVDLARRAVTAALGASRWAGDLPPAMTAEDFAYYLQRVPGAYLWLGLGESCPGLHHPAFDFPDAALRSGILALCAIALEYLAG